MIKKIIFDRKAVAARATLGNGNNSPEQLIKRRTESLKLLAMLCDADSVEYKDYDKSEEYLITKGKKTYVLDICGNHFDGGWMNITEIRDAGKK